MNLFFWRKKKEQPQPTAGSMKLIQEGPLRFAVTLSGVISPRIVATAQTKIVEVCRPGTKSRGIIRAEELQGFVRGFDGGVDEVERMRAVDEVIERIAVVAAPGKHEEFNLFMAGWMRKAQVKFFAPQELDKARAWLES